GSASARCPGTAPPRPRHRRALPPVGRAGRRGEPPTRPGGELRGFGPPRRQPIRALRRVRRAVSLLRRGGCLSGGAGSSCRRYALRLRLSLAGPPRGPGAARFLRRRRRAARSGARRARSRLLPPGAPPGRPRTCPRPLSSPSLTSSPGAGDALRLDVGESFLADAFDPDHAVDRRKRPQLEDLAGPFRADVDDALQLLGRGVVDVDLPGLTGTRRLLFVGRGG